ncbi:MAG TPA: hypothetical protein VN493_09080 [Thermoanaerobaculia bacterium]|nr:hypothetical protein [Thermoanaerobaculia bacterium]
MGSKLSIVETLAHLETKIGYHRGQHELHTKQEAFHAEQKVIHEAELAKAVEQFQLLKAASEAIGDIVMEEKPSIPAPPPLPEDVDTSHGRWLSRLVKRLLESKAPHETFSATTVAKEIRDRWGSNLRRPFNPRTIAVTLRRWALEGKLHQVREGRAYREALYMRERQP